jgi:hypothetical protein
MIVLGDNFNFVHIPKTGGTTVRNILEQSNLHKYVISFSHITLQPSKYDYHIRFKDLGLVSTKDRFKFCFVRNPWEHRVSYFTYVKHKYKKIYNQITFESFIREYPFRSISYYLDDTYDKIYQYEDINNSIDDICNKIGIREYSIPWLNKSNHDKFITYYNKKLAAIVENQEKYLLSKFNYENPFSR